MDTFAFLLYGSSEKYWAELRLSALSLIREAGLVGEAGERRGAFRIVAVCDAPGPVGDLPVELDVVGPATIRTWSGTDGYNHRAKLSALSYLTEKYSGRVVLVDTDTYFVADPARLLQRIGPGHAVMHAAEGAVGDDDSGLAPRMGSTPIALPGGGEFCPTPQATLWNSGIVGLHDTDRDVLTDASVLLDELYRRTGAFSVEQFAIGQALARACSVTAVDDVVVHYWGVRRDFLHARLHSFEAKHGDSPLPVRADASRSVTAEIPTAHPLDRVRAKMRRAAGLPPEYVAACLAAWTAERSRRGRGSRDLATPWERMARYHCEQIKALSEGEQKQGGWSTLHGRYLQLWLSRDPALQRVRHTPPHTQE